MKEFRFGAVLKVQREYSREKLYSMLDSIKLTGMNTVVVWPAVYWWDDPSEPEYPFRTGLDILTYAEKIGLKIVMELAGQIPCLEYAPDFKFKEEYYALNRDGSRNCSGDMYGYYNFNHPELRRLVEETYRQIAEHYRDCPALFGYDIWNETMFTSFDGYTREIFQNWLKDKYGTVEALNDSWDRSFTDFSQADFSPWLWASVMPKVDYEEFHKDNVGMILDYMREAIRAVDTVHPVIADNIFSELMLDMSYDRPQDDWNVARRVDIFGMDMYPKFAKELPIPDFARMLAFVGASSASPAGEFWVSEMQTHHTFLFDPSGCVYPQEIRRWCMEAVSQGAKGIVFWKWDPFIKGRQTLGRGLVDRKGRQTERTEAAAEVAAVLRENQHAFLSCRPVQPAAAILHDRLSNDFFRTLAVSILGRNELNSLYLSSNMALYKCLWDQNIPARYVTDADVNGTGLDGYRVLFVSNHITMNGALAEGLKRFVAEGGVVVADGKFGDLDETGVVREEIPNGGLCEALGFELMDNRADGLEMSAGEGFFPGGFIGSGILERRDLLVGGEGVEVLARFADGEPAIVRKAYGKGAFLYIATQFWAAHLKGQNKCAGKLITALDRECGLRRFGCSDDRLKVYVKENGREKLVFAFNYTADTLKAAIKVSGEGGFKVRELFSNEAIPAEEKDGELCFTAHVGAQGTTVYRIDPEEQGYEG